MKDYNEETRRTVDLARQQRLTVLIWGPGDPGKGGSPEAKEAYEKRCLIRQVLKDKFPRSEIDFSEDRDNEEILGQLEKQLVDAKDADAVIILDMSRGAHLELDFFTQYSWFREKVWLLVKQEYLGTTGLVAEVFKLIPQKQIQGFTDEEFKRCDVAKIMSVKAVTTAAVKKFLRD